MSVRMLQRALRNNQADVPVRAGIPSDADNSDFEGDERVEGEAVSNPFDILGLQDDDEIEEGDGIRDSNQQLIDTASAAPQVATGKSKRKKNKSKKHGKKESSACDRAAAGVDGDGSVDELFEGLAVGHREGGVDGNGEVSSSKLEPLSYQNGNTPRQSAALPDILAVDAKHLRAEDELRRIFGSKVINSVEAAGAQRRRQGGSSRRSGRGITLRKNVLVVPMGHWARWDGGITMDCIKVEGHYKYFKYQYSSSYQEVQKVFEYCVGSHDPNTIVMLLRRHPYHVDSLLALAEVYKQIGEHQQAADLLEQCLYALECAWHPSFNPTSGPCRLEFSCDTNKSLFVSLFRHMQHLGRRGCHRTALEVCKLLLSLDPSDPLGALFCIDYFALRAEQYVWLSRFVEQYTTDKAIALLPNFSFSLAVACFHLEDQQGVQQNPPGACVPEDGGHLANSPRAENLLQQALMLYPSVLKKIVEKAPIKQDVSWTKILSHVHFDGPSVVDATIEHLINIYVERNSLIWRSPELQGWLKQGAVTVTQIADKSQDPNSCSEMANWEFVRKQVFQSNHNEYKHLHLSDFSESASTLPAEEIQHMGFHPHRGLAGEGDEADLPFDTGHAQQALHQAASQGRTNGLLAFLQSLVPWMDHGGEAVVGDAPALLEEGRDQNDSIARGADEQL